MKLAEKRAIQQNSNKTESWCQTTKTCSEVIVVTKQQNKFLSIKNNVFSQILTQNASNELKWPKNKQYGQIARKTKYMSKTGEKTENRLEMVFMTKDQKECVFK